ncbi:MAG: UDP-3-O-(3-hydroxymyristoyl)glucosamine N-acyltransferase [Alphaproteobacteria bacterium]|nr:UDP-3-O-(3-hydroxymyristoyl)glucosamine N-acyltransferase [Alphaproteobacteria bacterium]
MQDRAGAAWHTLGDLAQALDAAVHGEAGLRVRGLDHPARATAEQIALAVEPAALKHLSQTKARAAVVAEEAPAEALAGLAGWIAVKRGRVALSTLTRLFAPPPAATPGVHPRAAVDPSAAVAPGASIGALAYVGPGARIGARTIVMPQASVEADAEVGEDCVLHSGVRIGARVQVGNRVILHANACLGADGFSFVTPEPGPAEMQLTVTSHAVVGRNDVILKIHSLGTVVIEDDVEIGACTTVDRATFGATVIRRGAKIDNQVQIAHNCAVGENCLIAAQVGISGSARIGNRVVLGGQVGVADHVSIGDDALVGAAAAVGQDVPAGVVYLGYPAGPVAEKLQERMGLMRLPRLLKEFVGIGKRLTALERRLDSARGG